MKASTNGTEVPLAKHAPKPKTHGRLPESLVARPWRRVLSGGLWYDAQVHDGLFPGGFLIGGSILSGLVFGRLVLVWIVPGGSSLRIRPWWDRY